MKLMFRNLFIKPFGKTRDLHVSLSWGSLLVILVMINACEIDQTSNSGSEQMEINQPVDHTWTVEAAFRTEGTVMSIWGADEEAGWTESKLWAVGGQPERGVLWHRQDEEWIEDETPDGSLLNWVHGVDGHLWVVGNDGRALRKIDAAAGGDDQWESFDTDTEQDLWGVFAMSPNEVWAVGGDPIGSEEVDPVLTRFDGSSWQRVSLPEPDRSGVRALFKIFGDRQTGAVFAVGMKGVMYGDIGHGWVQLPVHSINDQPPSVEDFVSIWGQNNELVAVGGRSNGVIARWNGQEWYSSMLSGIPGLNGVWVDETGHTTSVGVRGASLRLSPQTYEGVRERTNTALVLHAVWGTGPDIWAVGGSLDRSPPWEGVIIHSAHQ